VFCLALASALLICSARAGAQTPAPTPTPTPDPCNAEPGKSLGAKGIAKCLQSGYNFLTKHDLHLVHGSVVPGAGLTGGIGYSHHKDKENGVVEFNTSARMSIRKYWELDSNLKVTRGSTDTSGTTAEMKFNFYGLVKDMPRLDFFGIGPETRRQDRAVYHYREGVVGMDVSKPVLGWLNLGGAFEGVFPDIVRIKNPTANSVERAYTEATAPGITAQPAYLHYVAFASLHTPGEIEHRYVDYRLFYHFYQDLQEHRYSFRRFDADLRNKFTIGGTTTKTKTKTDKNGDTTQEVTSYSKNELRVRLRLSLSETSAGQRVPFYLMPTLGGSNISGEDTLRGFRDFRFRDRDLFLAQFEYLREIKGPVDFIAFYDTGKVASSVSHFWDGRLRHTYGLGFVFVPRQRDNILFRFYVALGSGEGSHTYFGGGLPGRADRLIR
jgi:hypothetical protein